MTIASRSLLATLALLSGCGQLLPSDEEIDRIGDRVEARESRRIRQEAVRDKHDYGFSAEAKSAARADKKIVSLWAIDKNR